MTTDERCDWQALLAMSDARYLRRLGPRSRERGYYERKIASYADRIIALRTAEQERPQ